MFSNIPWDKLQEQKLKKNPQPSQPLNPQPQTVNKVPNSSVEINIPRLENNQWMGLSNADFTRSGINGKALVLRGEHKGQVVECKMTMGMKKFLTGEKDVINDLDIQRLNRLIAKYPVVKDFVVHKVEEEVEEVQEEVEEDEVQEEDFDDNEILPCQDEEEVREELPEYEEVESEYEEVVIRRPKQKAVKPKPKPVKPKKVAKPKTEPIKVIKKFNPSDYALEYEDEDELDEHLLNHLGEVEHGNNNAKPVCKWILLEMKKNGKITLAELRKVNKHYSL